MSDKLGVIDALIDRVDALLIGGAMAFTLIAADGGEVGESLVERDRFDEVRATRARATAEGRPDRGAVGRRGGRRRSSADAKWQYGAPPPTSPGV